MHFAYTIVQVAKAIAYTAHIGQTDKAGVSYITHPARVASRVFFEGGTEEQQAAAWLHDVLEDTKVDAHDLAVMGIPSVVIGIVDALTKRPGESYEDAVARAAAYPESRLVKRCDVADNADPSRMARLDASTRDRLVVKYARAQEILRQAEEG